MSRQEAIAKIESDWGDGFDRYDPLSPNNAHEAIAYLLAELTTADDMLASVRDIAESMAFAAPEMLGMWLERLREELGPAPSDGETT